MIKSADIETIIKPFADRNRRISLITFRGHGEATHRMRTGLGVGTRRIGTTALQLLHLG